MYADFIKEMQDVSLVAVCDIKKENLNEAVSLYGVAPSMCFDNIDGFYAKGKIADGVIISTQDADHFSHIIPALNMGYDVLLEKPMATKESQCRDIVACAQKNGRMVLVSHVLRYTAFYEKIKEMIDGGAIGEIIDLTQTENIGYWHYAHSYIRGAWRNKEQSSEIILAKCSHDLDIIAWLMGEPCETVSSFGDLTYFNSKNHPAQASEFCIDCKLGDTCPYNCFTIYKRHVCSVMGGLTAKNGKTTDDFNKMLTDRKSNYGRCVFCCDNNVCDHQKVNMRFASGKTASLNMTAFSQHCYRFINVHGSLGEMYGNFDENKFTYIRYGESPKVIDMRDFTDDFSCHGGGDRKLLQDFIECIKGGEGSTSKTTAQQSLQSHLMAFGAEASRLENGAPKPVK